MLKCRSVDLLSIQASPAGYLQSAAAAHFALDNLAATFKLLEEWITRSDAIGKSTKQIVCKFSGFLPLSSPIRRSSGLVWESTP